MQKSPQEILNEIIKQFKTMPKSSIVLMICSLLFFCSKAMYSGYEKIQSISNSKKNQHYLVSKDDFILGNKDSYTEIYIIGDTTCGHCAVKFDCIINEILGKKYFQSNNISIIFKTIPSNLVSFRIEQILKCFAKNSETHYKMLEIFFKNQRNIMFEENGEMKKNNDIVNFLDKLAIENFNITQDQINACVNNPQYKQEILDMTKELIKKFEISSVPIVFINGKKLDNIYTCYQLDKAIVNSVEKNEKTK